MDQPDGRVPAWRRLGLKLKSEVQSGAAAPDLNGPQNVGHQPVELSTGRKDSREIVHAVGQTDNGERIKLGKRKTHHLAEGHSHAVKKSRNGGGQDRPRGNAAEFVSVASREDNGTADTTPEAELASGVPRPRGDPNYRRKGNRMNRQQTARPLALSPSEEETANGGIALLASTETDAGSSPLIVTPKRQMNEAADSAIKARKTPAQNQSPPRTDRRKSVTFTPDTKTIDGNSASNLFKKWMQEQKGKGDNAEFSLGEVAQFAPPPEVHPANSASASQAQHVTGEKIEKKAKKRKGQEQTKPEPTSGNSAATGKVEQPQIEAKPSLASTASKSKKKDPLLYISYLTRYYNDREHWKFNKAKQNDILDNALNIFRIPDEHSEALIQYVQGLKGAGVIERLKERCNKTLQELSEVDASQMSTMDDLEVRKAVQEEALQERIIKEKKRRRLEGDIEGLTDHPYSDGYIRRLKRRRAEALLKALNLAAQIQALNQHTIFKIGPNISQQVPRKRKLRTAISSDESSSDTTDTSSDESSSSSESESQISDEESESGDDPSDSSTATSASDSDHSSSNTESGPETEISSSSDSD